MGQQIHSCVIISILIILNPMVSLEIPQHLYLHVEQHEVHFTASHLGMTHNHPSLPISSSLVDMTQGID